MECALILGLAVGRGVRAYREDGLGARAVQIVHSSHRSSRDIEHIGSADDGAQPAALKSVARQQLAAGQAELHLRPDDNPAAGGPLEITSSRMGHPVGCAVPRV